MSENVPDKELIIRRLSFCPRFCLRGKLGILLQKKFPLLRSVGGIHAGRLTPPAGLNGITE